jgi:putative transposase
MFVVDLFKSRNRLEAANLFLRHQLNIALRLAPPRPWLRGGDRALLIWLTQLSPGLLDMTRVVQPETILRWLRAGFKVFWRWKSRNRAGWPTVDRDVRDLIRRISKENPLLGRPPDTWRTIDARVRSRTIDCLEIHGATSESAVSNLEDISSKSC